MKKTIAAILTGLVLTGCSVDNPVQAPEQNISKKEQFLSVVRDEYPRLNNVSDKVIVRFAKSSCRVLDEGATIEELFLIVASSDIPPKVGGFIIGAGIVTFCPEYQSLLDNGSSV